MTDENATVRRHLRHATEHLAAVQRQREAAQALAASHLQTYPQTAADAATDPTTEANPQ